MQSVAGLQQGRLISGQCTLQLPLGASAGRSSRVPAGLRRAACSRVPGHSSGFTGLKRHKLRPSQQQQQQQQQGLRLHTPSSVLWNGACTWQRPAAAGDAAEQQPEQLLEQQQQQQQQRGPDQQQSDLQPQHQPQPHLALPQLELPPSRSAALWLSDLDGTQLQQQAQDWGYQQVGRPLPEGLSLTAITETIPEEAFELDLAKALGYLAMSLAVMAAGYAYLWYWHAICPLWQQLVCWLVIGTGYFGAFQTAVDCAHFAFWPGRPLVQDVLGALLMAPSLFSYEVFRLKYFNHIMCINQLDEDTDAWQPLLPSDLADMPRWQATLLRLVMATPLKFFASVGQWFRSLEGFDLKLYPTETRGWVWLSWTLPFAFIGLAWPAMIAAGGVGGWVSWWFGPWIVFHGWLSVLSLVQHTGPHIPWAEEGLTYDQAQAAINGTVTLQLPRWLEVLLHHANCHLPSHLSAAIPSYNCPVAQRYLQQRLGRYLTVADLNSRLLINLMTAWQVYDQQRQRYVDFDAAEELVQQYRQQQQQQSAAGRSGSGAAAAAGAAGNGVHSSGGGGGSSGSESGGHAAEQQAPAVGWQSSSPAAFGV